MPRGDFSVSADLPLDARMMFIERDSAAFRALLSKTLKIGQIEFREMWEEGSSTFVRTVTKPEFGESGMGHQAVWKIHNSRTYTLAGAWVPRSVANSVKSSNLEFHDIVEYNPQYMQQSPFRIFVRTESPMLHNKLDIHLTLTIEELGPGRCRQSLTGRIRVNVFGVGRVVEGIVRDSLQTTYRKLPAIVERWAAFRSRALAQGNGHALVAGRPPVGQRISWIRREVAPLRDGGGSVESEAVAAAAAAAIAEGSMLPDQATESTKNTQPSPAPSLAAPEPQPSESPELLKRRAAAARTTRPLDLSQAEILYYDANDALGEPSPGPVPPTNPPLQPSPSPLPNPRPETVAAVTSPPAPRVLAQPRPPPSHHHRHSNSVDSVELALDADMAEHMASSRLWGRFNRYWDDWSAYWAAQGVEEEARAEEEAEVQARGGTVVGGLLSAVGRELYLGGSALLLVTYLSAMRLGLPTHPDHGLQRGEGQRSRPLPPPLPPKAAVVSPGPRPQLSLDRAEAELARALVKDGKPFQVTSSANEGDDSAVICAAVPAVPGEGGGAVVGSAAAKNGKKRKAARVCLTCSWMHCSATHSA